jgi:hypothetical protein
MKQTVLAGFILVAALAAGCGTKPAATAADAAPAAPAVEHIATTKQVMLGLTIPASDVLFQISNAAPKDDAGWDRIVGTAAMLAESGNLLLTGPRDLKQPEWTQLAQAMVARAKDAMAAAGKHDVEAVLDAGNGIYESCENCHNKFMPAKLAEQAAAAQAAAPAK